MMFLAPRDKPKRYSSQRQKTGASLLDIPGQIPEDEESRTQYYNQLGRNFVSTIPTEIYYFAIIYFFHFIELYSSFYFE